MFLSYPQLLQEWYQEYWKFINKILIKNVAYYNQVSKNPNITWEIIKDNPTLPWNWSAISLNPNIDFQTVKENLDRS